MTRTTTKPTFVYSKKYDFKLLGFEKLHPFDSAKFSKAWRLFLQSADHKDEIVHKDPGYGISDEQLLLVHTQAYLDSLQQSKNIADIIEISLARLIPNSILRRQLLLPMRYACQGTIVASEAALSCGMAMNVGGGFHHASAGHGEGFCVFADAALSIQHLRKHGHLQTADKILMIDLDAHRGNGFDDIFADDTAVQIFDMYNAQVYPGLHPGSEADFPYMIPLKMGTSGDRYLKTLDEMLEQCLNQNRQAKLVYYNAGTDILSYDPLGGLNVSYADVIKRDRMVIDALRARKIPTVVITSGGYSSASHKLIAELATYIHSVHTG